MINELSQQQYFGYMRPEMVAMLPSEYSKILEVGCNVGNFSQYINKPCEYWGIEPFENAAKVAKTKLDKILVGFYEEVENEIPDNYFDLVIANDVIEHMKEPWLFLQDIKKKMSPNGSLVLSIPNVRYYSNLIELLQEKDWKYRNCGILDITHLRFFTQKSIVRLLDESGFEIEKTQGINRLRKRGSLKCWLGKLILGEDIMFLQFGVRARIK